MESPCEWTYSRPNPLVYQCGFKRNRSTVDHIFSIRQILEKMWQYNNEVCQLFIDFEKAYDSIKRESLFDILIKFGVPRKLVRLIKTCLDGTQSKVRIVFRIVYITKEITLERDSVLNLARAIFSHWR